MASSIMVVEDDGDLRETVEELLRERGHDVIGAGHGEEALAILKIVRPDIILLDLEMPVMDGARFLEWKQMLPRIADVPVIVLSGRRAGSFDITTDCVAVLPKPLALQMLLDSLATHLSA